jgi:hypothetical protein
MILLKSNWTKFFIFIVIILAISYYGINPFLNKLLKEQVESKLIGNFSYKYDTIEVNIFKRSVVLREVAWQFPKDSSQLQHKGRVKQFTVKGISWTSIFGDLNIQTLSITSPEFNSKIQVNKLLNQKEDTVRLDQFNFYSLIKGQLKSLKIDQITITNAEAKWFAPDFKTVWREVNDGSLKMTTVVIDSTTTANQNGMFGLDQFILSFRKASIFLADSLHQISLGKGTLNKNKQLAEIDSIQIKVLLSEKEIHRQFKYEKAAITLLAPKTILTGANIDKLFTKQYVDIQKIKLSDLQLQVYKDKNAINPYFKKPPLPQILIQQLSQSIKLDSILIDNASISYTQKSKETGEKGYVFFTELNTTITHLTNDSLSLQENPLALMNFNTKLYGKSQLQGKIFFDMTSKTQAHTFEGELFPFDLMEANRLLAPLTTYQFKSGHVNQLKFRFNADNQRAIGSLSFLYDKLRIEKGNSYRLKGNQLDEQLISFVANTFIIKNSNPDWLGKEREGQIYYDRNINKSIFHYWWYAILSGLKTVTLPSQVNK